ncbi:hypothetical protein GCM10010287_08630 [Streptomyces variabilis]|uniref:Uncharacterized protein n=1 Tax=Streptomyces variabilis TaxID=67372 RepID=A0ABQ2TRX3_9ACTN|nr:hypothetical protein GCM10010265_15510 [Streptomyces griseoincarnatus]GGT38326.1 hypothetical protein GCM10010287_08630 [Streptomyces variabilis]
MCIAHLPTSIEPTVQPAGSWAAALWTTHSLWKTEDKGSSGPSVRPCPAPSLEPHPAPGPVRPASPLLPPLRTQSIHEMFLTRTTSHSDPHAERPRLRGPAPTPEASVALRAGSPHVASHRRRTSKTLTVRKG